MCIWTSSGQSEPVWASWNNLWASLSLLRPVWANLGPIWANLNQSGALGANVGQSGTLLNTARIAKQSLRACECVRITITATSENSPRTNGDWHENQLVRM